MLKEVFKIDINGYIEEKFVAEFDKEGNSIEELPSNVISKSIPQGLFRAKWTGAEWVEDITQEEIDALNDQPKELTENEVMRDYILNIDYRLILMELRI